MRILAFLLLSIYSCNYQRIIEPVEIVIDEANSYSYDIANGIYIVHMNNKKDLTINFIISDKDKNQILKEFYRLELDKISSEKIEDDCYYLPKLLTTIHIKTKEKSSVISIDMSCNNFKWNNFREADKVKQFISFQIIEVNSAEPRPRSPRWETFLLLFGGDQRRRKII